MTDNTISGGVVPDGPTPEELEHQELERKIALLELSRINLRVSPPLFEKLNRQAEFHGLSIEDHCTKILEDSLNVAVGKAWITGPRHFGETPAQERKVMGPSEVSTVTRA